MKKNTCTVSNTFDGLTPEERERIKAMGEKAMNDYLKALQIYFSITIKNRK